MLLQNISPNPLIKNLLALTIPANPKKRLKRKWCVEIF